MAGRPSVVQTRQVQDGSREIVEPATSPAESDHSPEAVLAHHESSLGGYGSVRDIVRDINHQAVLTGVQILQGDQLLQGHLLSRSGQLVVGLQGSPDFLPTFLQHILDGGGGLLWVCSSVARLYT